MSPLTSVPNGVHCDGNTSIDSVIAIHDQRAVIAFDAEIALFKGEFIDLNGGADFYATDVAGLRREGAKSLAIFLRVCKEYGIEPTLRLEAGEVADPTQRVEERKKRRNFRNS